MVDNYFTRQYIPEDNSEHRTRRRENLNSHIVNLYGEATLRCIRRFESLRIKVDNYFILHGSISQKTILNIVLAAVRT
jgi:hypothetical protein